MTVFLLVDATGVGTGEIDSNGAFVDLVVIANETGIGLDAAAGGMRRVTYTRTLAGPPQLRLDELVNTAFQPDYGAGPQAVDIIVISVPDNFVFGDGSFGVVDNGTALPPNGSGLGGAALNPTVNCLVLYDTRLEICVARAGTGGTIDLRLPGPVVLYHELSHARRIVRNELLALGGGCNPSSAEENAAITDENDMRTQLADLLGEAAVLRDAGNHCGDTCPPGSGNCCIVATLVSGSARSPHVQRLREVRDGFLRMTATGHEFFERLHYDYYGFSPQVCALIAGRPRTRDLVLHGFVEPLLGFWQFMVARAGLDDPDDAELGALFLEHAPAAGERREQLEYVERVRGWVVGDTDDPDVPPELVRLLAERAWPHESVQWAMVHPVRIHHEALREAVAGSGPEAVGRSLRPMLDDWTSALPITGVWGTLTADELATELEMCDRALFQSAAARDAFRVRLARRFPEVTAVGRMAAGPSRGGTR